MGSIKFIQILWDYFRGTEEIEYIRAVHSYEFSLQKGEN